MLKTYAGADGLKTGYTEASGYNVVTSAVRGETRLIGVVLGASNGWERDREMTAMLDQGFWRMGVSPVEMARREPGFRVPSLIGSAQAAPVMARVPVVVEPGGGAGPGRWSARRGRINGQRVARGAPEREWPLPPRAMSRSVTSAIAPQVMRSAVSTQVSRAARRYSREPPRVTRQFYLGRSPG